MLLVMVQVMLGGDCGADIGVCDDAGAVSAVGGAGWC